MNTFDVEFYDTSERSRLNFVTKTHTKTLVSPRMSYYQCQPSCSFALFKSIYSDESYPWNLDFRLIRVIPVPKSHERTCLKSRSLNE